MFKSLLRNKKLLLLLLAAFLVKLFSLNAVWVERYYTYGFYPFFSRCLRLLVGWIPFSVGDLAYLAAYVFLVVKAWKLIRLLARRKLKQYLSWILLAKYLSLVLWIYILFNVFWGLNYNRIGIAGQLKLQVQAYNATDVYQLGAALQKKLNYYAARVDTVQRLQFNNNGVLFTKSIAAYQQISKQYPYLTYKTPSLKPSLYSFMGAYLGFTGYYNPFSGEAQLKTSIPSFVKPFVVCHEMAHQLGYGKENEANMVAFLAGRTAPDMGFRYSAYYDVYLYTMGALRQADAESFLQLQQTVHPQFVKDYETYLMYLYANKNVVEPIISQFYDRYLKLNNQPKGKATYNEVVAWLVAYMKKYGADAL